MEILYLGTNPPIADDSGDCAEKVLLDGLRGAGYEVTVKRSSDLPLPSEPDAVGQFEAGHHHASPLSTTAALVADIADSMERYDLVITRGVALNRLLLEDERLVGRVWLFLTDTELALQTALAEKAEPSLQNIVQKSRLTLVENWESLCSIRKMVPLAHHQIFHITEEGKRNSKSRMAWLSLSDLARRAKAHRRVLFYRDRPGTAGVDWVEETFSMAHSLASPEVQVILMCHDALSIFGSDFSTRSPHVTLAEPRSASHQVSHGRLLPRFAAWHVAVAAKSFDCAVVLTDDLETVKYGFSNDYLKTRLWPVVRLANPGELEEHEDAYEHLSSAVNRLVFSDHESRAMFESRISAATSKTVVIPGLSSQESDAKSSPPGGETSSALLKQHLDRATADYTAVPEMEEPLRVLAVGHDFKFAGELLDLLSYRDDVELRADHWASQTAQDEVQSRALIDWADVIFCEFASHNAVWYSWEKRKGQTLVVRFHGYELYSPWIHDINLSNVDKFVFVSEFYREKVVEKLNWPREKTAVIPNVVDVLDLKRPKSAGSRFHLGIAGIVPILKRPDRALDLLEILLSSDERYTLHIRGRNPWDYGWMWQQDDVREAYEAFYERLALNPKLRRRVAFEEFGPDMGRWFQNIGWALSPSYRETFHLAPVEGMASGAVPVVWEREGADEIFGQEWVHQDTEAAAHYILRVNESEPAYRQTAQAALEQARKFDVAKNGDSWLRLIFAAETAYSDLPSQNITPERQEEVFAKNKTTTNLSRLIRVLHRDGNFLRMEEVAALHPHLAKDLPPHLLFDSRWRAGMQAMREAPPAFIERAYGPAYLTRPGTVMLAVDGRCDHRSAIAWPPGWIAGVEDGLVQMVAVASAAVDPQFDPAAYGRTEFEISGLPATQLALRHSSRLSVDRFVMAAADALVREARVVRPAAIAAHGDFHVAFPALIAARRLGVPFMITDSLADEPLAQLCRAEADGFLYADSDIQAVVVQAAADYHAAVDSSRQLQLDKLRIGVIADQFTSATISRSFQTIPLSRSQGYVQVASLEFDAIFVESAWEGPDNEWRRGVAYYADGISDLQRILDVAKARRIPVIFWNKEDPVHFKAFKKTASMMDNIFTTDADMVSNYLELDSPALKTVASLPFFAEPKIHNPLPTNRVYDHSVSYAGTYYGDRFRERSLELQSMLNVAKIFGLTIYDRQVNVPDSPYQFPPELRSFVREGVPYEEVLQVYKAHPVNINVNSVDDSPTMFSRRVVEIAASGSVVLSGKGRGIDEQLGTIEAGASDDRWEDLLNTWMSDENARLCEVWSQMRTISRSHLANHAMALLMRTVGIPVVSEQLPSYGVIFSAMEKEDVAAVLRQTWRPTVVFGSNVNGASATLLRDHGIAVHDLDDECAPRPEWVGSWTVVPNDSYFEDILHATRFGTWDYISGRPYKIVDGIGKPIVEQECSGTFSELRLWPTDPDCPALNPLTWVMPDS